MALQMTTTASTGITVTDAYLKVVEYSCAVNNDVSAHLRAYTSKQAVDEGLAPLEGSDDIITLTIDYSDDADNAKKQIYEYAKKLDKYCDAVDV